MNSKNNVLIVLNTYISTIITDKYFKRQDNTNETPEEEAGNSLLIYVVLIVILVLMIVGVIVFAIIHRKQDKKKEKEKEEEEKKKSEENEEKTEKDKEKKETKISNLSLKKNNKDKESMNKIDKQEENDDEYEIENGPKDISNLKNALEDESSCNEKKRVESSNDYYYQDYNQKSPILYNNKKNNMFDSKNPTLLKMSNRPHSVIRNTKQNRISVNPSCLPEIKFRPESLMFEAEFAQEVSKIFKNYDESMKFSSSVQSTDSFLSQRINKSQARDSMSISKRSSNGLQINRQSKNIKRKNKNSVKKRISQNRSSIILLPYDIDDESSSKRNSQISSIRTSIIQKGTYNSNTEYYFSSESESPSSNISPLNYNASAVSSPTSYEEASPSTECNISIDITNMNIKNKNRVSRDAVKTNSNIYFIQQMPFKIQYNNEASKYDSVNIMIENTNDSLDEDSVVLNIEENGGSSEVLEETTSSLPYEEKNNENENESLTESEKDISNNLNEDDKSEKEQNEDKNENNDNKSEEDNTDENTNKNDNVKLNDNKLKIVIDSSNKLNTKINKEASSAESVTYDICESMFNEQNKENEEEAMGLMSPICESDFVGNTSILKDNLHLCQNQKRQSDQFSVNLKCQEDNISNKLSAESNTNLYVENDKSIKRNTFGFFDVNSQDAIKKLNDNINKRMTLSNDREFKDLNNP